MKFFSFPKPRLPKFLSPSFYQIKHHQLLKIWKKFLTQIPREFRSITKTHQHFIILGDDQAGKSELVQSIVEQSQNIYPFEVEFTKDKDLQVYLGPKQIIQEFSLDTIKDRSIRLRRSIIHLWKRLYVKTPPIVIIAYNPFLENSKDLREINKLARLIAGKLTLLGEISKAPLKVRLALTHLDKVKGYLEFARFLKMHNILFELPIITNFESKRLEEDLAAFREKYLSLILTSTTADNYMKILGFFDQLPKYFPFVEEFLRVLTIGNGSSPIELETLTFSSNLEPYTSFSTFDWSEETSGSIFFRHPMLKHQIAAAAVLVVSTGLVLNNFSKDRQQILLSKEGIDSLIYLQQDVFVNDVIPEIERINEYRPQEGYLPFLPRFYKKELRETNHQLAQRVRKHILEPSLRKLMLSEDPELKAIYMLGLLHASEKNRLGQHILRNLSDWAMALHLDEKLVKSYILSRSDERATLSFIDHLDKINVSSPLSDPKEWIEFLSEFQSIVNQPLFIGHNFDHIRNQAERLLSFYRQAKNDKHAFLISTLLHEANSKLLSDFQKNLEILQWMEHEKEYLESFLVFVCESCPTIPDISDFNVSQFFAKLKEVAELTQRQTKPVNFLLGDEKFSFETGKWVSLSVSHIIERLIHQYIVSNTDSQGEIFFRNTPSLSPVVFESYRNEFPYFELPVVIDGRFSRLAFEKNVRNTAESLMKLLDSLPINPEDKDRFAKFLSHEVLNYSIQYQKEYEKAYSACNIHTSSLEEVKEVLKKTMEPSSSFEHFLEKMNHHTSVFADPTTIVSNLDEKNHFYFLSPLISQVKNKKSPFERYRGILEDVLVVLNTGKQHLDSVGGKTLDHYLTPAAKITLDILHNESASYVNQITENLSEIGVPFEYHFLFLAPVYQVYHIGIKDLKKGIDKLCEERLDPQLKSLYAKRPFNPQGTQLATFDEVHHLTNPYSEFWGVIRKIIEPVSFENNGMWSPNPSSDLQLSPKFYIAVNRLAKITHHLWDIEGNPQPIYFKIQSLPFERSDKAYPAPLVSYLVTGEETFHNFNQSPSWHTIKIEWWKENSSTVVMELANKNDSRSYRDAKVTHTPWSFFELLNLGVEKDQNIWSWTLQSSLTDGTSTVALRFDENPWELFQGGGR